MTHSKNQLSQLSINFYAAIGREKLNSILKATSITKSIAASLIATALWSSISSAKCPEDNNVTVIYCSVEVQEPELPVLTPAIEPPQPCQ